MISALGAAIVICKFRKIPCSVLLPSIISVLFKYVPTGVIALLCCGRRDSDPNRSNVVSVFGDIVGLQMNMGLGRGGDCGCGGRAEAARQRRGCGAVAGYTRLVLTNDVQFSNLVGRYRI